MVERLDQVAVGDLVDDPPVLGLGDAVRTEFLEALCGRTGDLGEGWMGLGVPLHEVGVGHVIADAEHLQVVDAPVEVALGRRARTVRKTTLCIGSGFGELVLIQEVEGRRRRCLEVEALHGTDTPVGPVRQEHQRHRVPYRSSSESYSHIARPHPLVSPSSAIVVTIAWYSG